jgi:hypothetical protein
MVTLERIPIKQQEWWKQIFPHIKECRRAMDRLSIAEIIELYSKNRILCANCGKELDIPPNWEPIHHIINLINPMTGATCDDCMYKLYKTGNILAGEIPQEWKDRITREGKDKQ